MKAQRNDRVSSLSLVFRSHQNAHTSPRKLWGASLSLTWKPRPQAGDRLPEGASLLSPNLQPQSCPGASGHRARAATPFPRSRLGLAHLLALPSGPRSWPIAASPGPLGGFAGSRPIPVSRLHRRSASSLAPPTLAACAHRTRAQASRTQRPRARAGRPALPGLAPPALSERGLLALRTRTVVALELHFQRHRWVRSPSEASYGPREPGRTDWAARVMAAGPPGSGCCVSSPFLTLSLSLSCLLGPQLASAGTFRVLKEPLAFLRALELVSSGVCAGRGPRQRTSR